MALESVEFYPFTSSNIDEAGYDGDDGVLYVRFLNGALYYYAGVPPQIWDEFLVAPSVGKFLHQSLKGFFDYGRVS